jgi:serine protease AprX
MDITGDTRAILLAVDEVLPLRGESWSSYRLRVQEGLKPVRHRAARSLGVELAPLCASCALYGQATDDAIHQIRAGVLGPEVTLIEWGDGWVPGGNALGEISMLEPGDTGATVPGHGGSTGRGVSVAVLDSGIDASHPCLDVAAAHSTCPEPAGVPGWHGTHCAGLIASSSAMYPGLAPGVRLLDIKVSRADGWLHPVGLARGIDAALDANADILSISVGINRLPANLGGNGWNCIDGSCLLCRAVNHAVLLGTLVVAAAGNEHLRVRSLRARGATLPAAAELLRPGGARRALAVSALETWPVVQLWPHSSRRLDRSMGPGLAAPGVELTSTVPVPKTGRELNPLTLFGTGTGTSMAAAVTAGAAALICERRRAAGLSTSPHSILKELLARCPPLLPPVSAPSRRLDVHSLDGHRESSQPPLPFNFAS